MWANITPRSYNDADIMLRIRINSSRIIDVNCFFFAELPRTPLRLVPKSLKPRLRTSQRFSWKMAASKCWYCLILRSEGEPFNANATAVITNRMPSLLSEYCCYAQIHKQLEACEFLSEPVRSPMAERFIGTAVSVYPPFSPRKTFSQSS